MVAGTGGENLVDGPAADALLAQPSGVTVVGGGVAFVDAESSSLRVLTDDGRVVTLVGQGLFEWGRADGPSHVARLQASVATSLETPITGGRVIAEGDLDFRGTMAVDRETPVGFRAIRLRFELDSPATPEDLATLLSLTERYCVVFQTIANGVPVTLDAA